MRLGPFDIFEGGLQRLRRDLGAAAIPILLGVATLVVGGYGWGLFVSNPGNITNTTAHTDAKGLFHRMVYGALRTVSDFAPSVWNVNEGNHWTDVAAILGAAAFYASVVLIGGNVLSETIRKLAARYAYRDHVVIIGETPLASRLREVWRRHVGQTLQVIAGGRARPPRRNHQVRSAMNAGIFARFGLARAANVVIDLGDDMATLSLAYDLLAESASGPAPADAGRRAHWTLVVRDRTLADHFAANLATRAPTLARLPSFRYFAPERALVRHFLASHPLFLTPKGGNGAEPGREPAIHALVIGSGAAVDELIQAIFQTSLIFGRDWPRVTVVSADPGRDRSTFFSSRPGLIGVIDVDFLPPAALDDFEPVARVPGATSAARWDRTLYDRDVAAPVNVIFLMDPDPDANSRFAIKLKEVQHKTGRLRGKLLACNVSLADDAGHPGAQAFGRTIDGYETFGLDDRYLDAEFCVPTRRQTLAYALHENYRDMAKANGQSGVPSWDGLPESLRRANDDAADHCLAKLYMLGFDVSRIPPGTIPRLDDADYATLRAALRVEPLTGAVHDLVFLEHDRWMLERRFDGWVFGDRRDNPKKIHPLLVPWDQLSKAEQDKDRDQVEALLQCLQAKGEGSVALARAEA